MPFGLDGSKGGTFPTWTTAGRPASPVAGQTGYNSTLGTLETYNGSLWEPFVARTDSGTVTPTMLSQPLTLATAQNTTSGSNIDFTGIPSWARRITIIFNGVSGTALPVSFSVVIGSSGAFETSGYSSLAVYASNGAVSGSATSTSNFLVANDASNTGTVSGNITLCNVSGNVWVASGVLAATNLSYAWMSGGSKTTSSALDRVRVTVSSGTFDAGSVNIMYEG